jgi:hypothetical protein
VQDIEEKVMMLKDAVLQPDCNLYYDYQGPHNRNFFGKAATLDSTCIHMGGSPHRTALSRIAILSIRSSACMIGHVSIMQAALAALRLLALHSASTLG